LRPNRQSPAALADLDSGERRRLRELTVLAQYTRRIERVPTSAERAVFPNAAEDATIETLDDELRLTAEQNAPRTGWGIGLGFFAKRRGEQAAALTVEQLAAWSERPARIKTPATARSRPTEA
jgi:hypothetical protein